ncbi:heat shock protein 101 [Plasmodium berghei]|uniref:Heat shock protein 101 n=2 Tax=Plasmodium berghei TaxID=5821 RepID=A0A509AK00_PLABA|nr:heat shock protein 101 [Plasmodium berghei ANKA]CXI44558.1 heat shock protein 101 [Plasmodium berghei]SCM22526.1 heat shock protein 101 [Plasmodium berghei]SCN25505.1 heat shock protein 101 [Plasmodium berghei]SCO60459.1 heat shock protein 101 [Plasmodium berghei]SCO62248.1 heat shock protein 101 [Plasmodium berghei]|eukprot:XP_034421662.1 heat shock protein 101 [Plasmodium berghei ANKA]
MVRNIAKNYLFVIVLLLSVLKVDIAVFASNNNNNQENFLNRTINTLNSGRNIAKRYGHNQLKPLHILKSIIKSEYGLNLFKSNNIDLGNLKEYTDAALEQTRAGAPLDNKTIVINSEGTNEVLAEAKAIAKKYKSPKVDIEHILYGLMSDELVSEIFGEIYLTEDSIKEILKNKFEKATKTKEKKTTGLNIEQFGSNLNEKVRSGKLQGIYGRDEEIRAIIESLLRYNKNSPVLVGQPGTGKTTIVEGLAYRIEKGDVPKELRGYTIISLNFRKFTAGTSYRGEFENRMKNIIKELKNKKNKIILFVDEIHLLLGAGKAEGGVDAANLLKPVLSKGEIKLIGATTVTEYRKYIESCSAFERRFEKIIVEPPSVETSIKILRSLKSKYEKFYGINITDKALVAAVKVSDKFIKDRFLPDKAIDLLNKACSFLQVQLSGKPRVIDLTERYIERLAYEITTLEKDVDKVSKKKYSSLVEEFELKKDELKKYYEEYVTTGERLKRKKEVERKLNELKDLVQNYINAGKEPPIELQESLNEAQKQFVEIYKNTVAYVEEKTHNAMNVDSLYQEHVSYIYLRDSGMPLGSLSFESSKGALKLYNSLSKSIIGNEDIIKSLSDAVVKAATGMKDPEKPIGTFLFLGPTGVGKTELAKTLAIELFNSKNNLIRVNMSEFTEAHSVSKITGSPPGYVGFSDSGQLTEAVRERPHSVVLFDELEKAHPDVFKVLLQILGDGYINDNHRRNIDFSNTIIIMTSNLGAELFKKQFFFDADNSNTQEYKRLFEDLRIQLIKKCKKVFKPEFVNRIDKIGIFEPLSKKNLHKIVKLRFKKLEKRLEEKNISIDISDRAIDYIIDQSYDPELGARPTLIFIESVIMTKFSVMYLEKELIDDMDVYVDYNKTINNIVINLSLS